MWNSYLLGFRVWNTENSTQSYSLKEKQLPITIKPQDYETMHYLMLGVKAHWCYITHIINKDKREVYGLSSYVSNNTTMTHVKGKSYFVQRDTYTITFSSRWWVRGSWPLTQRIVLCRAPSLTGPIVLPIRKAIFIGW